MSEADGFEDGRDPSGPSADYLAGLETLGEKPLADRLNRLGGRPGPGVEQSARNLAKRLGEPGVIEALDPPPGLGSRIALGLLDQAGGGRLPADRLAEALKAIGLDPSTILAELCPSGLAVMFVELPTIYEPAGTPPRIEVIAHPASSAIAESVRAAGVEFPEPGRALQVREADGLEPLLRAAAVWQRLDAGALRLTRQDGLFKRDRERIEADPALTGPIADAIGPVADLPWPWVGLAMAAGLIRSESSDRIVAAPADRWTEGAVHFPEAIARGWLRGSDRFDPAGPEAIEGDPVARVVALGLLSGIPEPSWVATEDLDHRLAPLMAKLEPKESRPTQGAGPTARLLLGLGYLLGLVRVAEESGTRRRLLQLAPMGRYVLGLGPPPSPRDSPDEFLVVQPNYEVIAYRQGLNPWLIGLLARFLEVEQIGGVVGMRLTAETLYRGLGGGLTADAVLNRLERHGGRPVPSGVSEGLKGWAGRRSRVAFHTGATLIEFATEEALEAVLEDWPEVAEESRPSRVGPRILLAPEEASIPLKRFRLAGSRDYRRPPEACVEVAEDGVTLIVDPSRSDLFIEAELARLADPLPTRPDATLRRYELTRESLARAEAIGLSTGDLESWFRDRTGDGLPPAARLLVPDPDRAPSRLEPIHVLRSEDPETLDGLAQHPSTARLIGERIGPTAAVVRDADTLALRDAIRDLGLEARLIGPGRSSQ